ncbi:hypothetical protein MKW92_018917 [Papaver armeniacum]|nr:hypothetical protein MKW92_018917 [Papaver armeniacum]
MDYFFHKRKQMIFEDVGNGKAQSSSQDPYQAVASRVFQINTALNDYRRLETTANLKVLRECDHGVGINTKKIIEDAKLARDYQVTLREFQKLQVLDIGREAAFKPEREQDGTVSHVESTAAKIQSVSAHPSMNSRPSWNSQDLEKEGAQSSSSESDYQAVAWELFQIDAALIGYLKLLNMVGTDKETSDNLQNLHIIKLRIGKLMKETSVNLKRLRNSDQGVGINTNEIIEAKLARDFLAILQDYQIIQGLDIEHEAAAFTSESYDANEQIGPDFDPECLPFLEEHKRDLAVLIHDQDTAASHVESTAAQIQVVKVPKSVSLSSWGPYQGVASGIFKINTALNSCRRLVNTVGTDKDTPDHGHKLRSTKQRIGQLVKETFANLKARTDSGAHSDGINPNTKTEDAKLAMDFQATLQNFQKIQGLAIIGREANEQLGPDVNPQSSTSQETLMLENEIIFNEEATIEETNQCIRDIHSQIVEIRDIYRDLAILIHEQVGAGERLKTQLENLFSCIVSHAYIAY